MSYLRDDHPGALGLALIAGVGLGLGIACGLVVGELLGDVNTERVKRTLGRLRRPERDEPEVDAEQLERDLREAFATRPEIRTLNFGVRTLGDGLVELTGTAPDEAARAIAGKVAERVPGADIVVNRILVEGIDTRDQPTASISRAP